MNIRTLTRQSRISLCSLGLSLLLVAGCGNSADAGGEIKTASLDEAVAAIQSGVTTLDVRSDEEWVNGHLVGARHIPINTLDANDASIGLSKDEPILVYCASGGRATRAAEQLQAVGFSRVSVLRPGGYAELRAQGLPVRVPD